ncbi:DUF4183 domain-containing protein [Alkalihalobacillus sp. CinArs1]|uniref:DUF4183 domain-containing protein n=1 Tax=Alkalihalobacillus sp. CinArs1 TaxID=2995314 RepID=UPI0022DD91C4|nr:DUF4183 domain-containing protein [Alkalihalobacillus sp. CinArs1]
MKKLEWCICPNCGSLFCLGECVRPSKKPLQTSVYTYYALSDGEKYLYGKQDELTEYGDRGILNPEGVSYTNLFINGVLQPTSVYEIRDGWLLLNTSSPPPLKGTPIILQFVTIYGGAY